MLNLESHLKPKIAPIATTQICFRVIDQRVKTGGGFDFRCCQFRWRLMSESLPRPLSSSLNSLKLTMHYDTSLRAQWLWSQIEWPIRCLRVPSIYTWQKLYKMRNTILIKLNLKNACNTSFLDHSHLGVTRQINFDIGLPVCL